MSWAHFDGTIKKESALKAKGFESFAAGVPGLKKYARLVVKAALAEDIGKGDITTDAIVEKGRKGRATFVAKEDMVVAGLFLAELSFKELDHALVFNARVFDGDRVRRGERFAEVSGSLSAILCAERVALNFLQRLSGIASLTRRFAAKTGRHKVKILDTRKTTPCLRAFEKYAVRVGGGFNHRFGLFDCVLIKDNHIAAAGGIKEAVRRVNRKYKDNVLIEAEAKTLKEVRDALTAGVDIIMLDNMGVVHIKKALSIIKDRAITEASGGITLENIDRVASTGVNFISIGALTHSARSVDISMEVLKRA